MADGRRELQQRCLAIVLRRFVGARETGVDFEISWRDSVRLVPRIVGLVVDQVEERNILCLMGCQSTLSCSHCMTRRLESCSLYGVRAPSRAVVATLEAQLHAAEVRMSKGP